MLSKQDLPLGVSEQLRALTDSGSLQADEAQLSVAAHLDRILDELGNRHPAPKRGALGWLGLHVLVHVTGSVLMTWAGFTLFNALRA